MLRILRCLSKLDFIHVMAKGKIIKSGDKILADELNLEDMDG